MAKFSGSGSWTRVVSSFFSQLSILADHHNNTNPLASLPHCQSDGKQTGWLSKV